MKRRRARAWLKTLPTTSDSSPQFFNQHSKQKEQS